MGLSPVFIYQSVIIQWDLHKTFFFYVKGLWAFFVFKKPNTTWINFLQVMTAYEEVFLFYECARFTHLWWVTLWQLEMPVRSFSFHVIFPVEFEYRTNGRTDVEISIALLVFIGIAEYLLHNISNQSMKVLTMKGNQWSHELLFASILLCKESNKNKPFA